MAAEQTLGPRGPARWAKHDLAFEVVVPPGSSAGDETSIMQSAEAAARSWDAACSDVHIGVVPQRHGVYAAAPDERNTVTFLSHVWCRAGQPTRGCHRSNELAATAVFFSEPASVVHESSITEADIEVNAVRFEWFGRGDQEKTPAPASLSAVLAHEMGHALGLDDACQRAPRECPIAPPSIMTSVAHGGRGERRPTPDDLAKVCAMYPRGPGTGAPAPPWASRVSGETPFWSEIGAAGAGLIILGMIGAQLSRRRTGRVEQRARNTEKEGAR